MPRRSNSANTRVPTFPVAPSNAISTAERGIVLLHVVEKRHETEVHVQLLVAVEESEAGIVGNEIDLALLIAAQHDHVLHDAGGLRSREISKLKAVTMKMDGMNVVAGIAHPKTVAPALLQME
jgi:phosphoribosylanthranilate isomerase